MGRYSTIVIRGGVTLLLCAFFAVACNSSGFENPANEAIFTRAQADLTRLTEGLQGDDDMIVSCAGILAETEPLLSETNEAAKALAEQLKGLCEYDVPLHAIALGLAEARAAFASGEFSSGCVTAENALEDIAENRREVEEVVAAADDVNLACNMERHVVRVEGMLAEARTELESDPTSSVLMACTSHDVYLAQVGSDFAEHERVTALRTALSELCGRDHPVGRASAQLDAAAAYAAANPDAIMNMDCTMARTTLGNIDSAFDADPIVTAVRARHTEVCGE